MKYSKKSHYMRRDHHHPKGHDYKLADEPHNHIFMKHHCKMHPHATIHVSDHHHSRHDKD